MNPVQAGFWSIEVAELLQRLQARPAGLSGEDASTRLAQYGPNLLKPPSRSGPFGLLLGQFKSPIILILIFAAGLSFFLGDHTDGVIVLGIVLVSGLLGFWQEHGAASAVAKLLADETGVSVREAESIVGEVQAAVARWTDFADQAGVSGATRDHIAGSL